MNTPGQRMPRWSRLAACLVAGAQILFAVPGAVAQSTGTVTGRVTDGRSGLALGGTVVSIQGTRLSAATASDGNYRIAGVPAGDQVVVARRIGYASMRRTVAVSAAQTVTADFALEASAYSLDEVVVTGTAGGEQRRTLGNAVAIIDAGTAMERSAAPDLTALLSSRSPGAIITPGSGRIGAGPTIQIRGRSTLSLSSEPIVYIDGVRVNNAVNQGPQGGFLGAQNAEPYARQMFHSLHDKLLAQNDYVGVLPTHGGGSLCSKDISSTPSSTIGYERRHNGLLSIPEIDDFVRALLFDQPGYPRYFARMRPINKAGATPLGTIAGPRSLAVAEVQALIADDALVIDARPYPDFAAGHLPGSFAIPAGSSFGTWLGWVVPDGRPLVLVLESVDDWDGLLRQALRIGYDDVRGHLSSVADWRAAGLPLETGKRASVQDLAALMEAGGPDAPLVLDVRQHDEWVAGHIPGSIHLMGGDLPDRLAELPRDRPIVTICRTSNRSAIAAGVLSRAGFTDVTWVDSGVPSWRRAGFPIEKGE